MRLTLDYHCDYSIAYSLIMKVLRNERAVFLEAFSLYGATSKQ
jgi:hypothetical protein